MANEEVLGPRKTMFVLVIVVGCFAVLWPRILSPLLLGSSREQLKPNQFDREAAIKQERPPIRGAGPHPALRERGRAIPPGVPAAPTRGPVSMPPHARVRSSPLSVYFELDIKPPPIPGMRPPLGSPGGPVPTPKSSMGFVMPIYTICIIVFFVYTLSKIMFKRTGPAHYETITPDPQFRRRVFRDDSRTSPDKLVVTAISGLVAEVQQQMEASYAQNQQRQDVQQDNTRPYTNGTILHSSGPVHIVASEYREQAKEASPEPVEEKEASPAPETVPETNTVDETKEIEVEKESTLELDENSDAKENNESAQSNEPDKESSPEPSVQREATPEKVEDLLEESSPERKESTPEPEIITVTKTEEDNEEIEEDEEILLEEGPEVLEPNVQTEVLDENEIDDLIKALDNKEGRNGDIRNTEDFLKEETEAIVEEKVEKQSTPELLEEAIKDEEDDNEKSSVKVVGMELSTQLADGGAVPRPRAAPPPPPGGLPRAHEAESVQSIFLETEIPQQSRVLVADFVEDRTDKPQITKHSPMVVSGKMTLSLIQDAPRDTPERDQESTIDDFTTASAVTQDAAEKQGEESDEEIEEEIEIEEIEEEVEEEEEEEEVDDRKVKEPSKK